MERLFDRALILLSEWDDDGGERFLLQSARLGWWELPWRERSENGSFREAAAAELQARYGLNAKRDFIVCSTPRLSLIVHPVSLIVLDRHEIDEAGFGVLEIYPVQLFGQSSRERLSKQRGLHWCSAGGFSERRLTPQSNTAIKAMEL